MERRAQTDEARDDTEVELVTTDGFLLPNAELERRGLMDRKGFPESYDRRALLRFVSKVKSGASEARAPFYSHLRYDIVSDAEVVVRRPDVLIVDVDCVVDLAMVRELTNDHFNAVSSRLSIAF